MRLQPMNPSTPKCDTPELSFTPASSTHEASIRMHAATRAHCGSALMTHIVACCIERDDTSIDRYVSERSV
jgi:hypothetical protein